MLRMNAQSVIAKFRPVLLFALMAVLIPSAQAQTYTVIHNFTGGIGGNYPYDGLTMDRAGNFYGTTYGGGASGQGSVFKLTNRNGSWIFTPLYSFLGGNDGAQPYAGVTIGPDGNLYGTTSSGGQGAPRCAGGCGTVYKLTPPARPCHQTICSWTETIVYDFYQSSAGLLDPYGGVIFDSAGDLYGTTTGGGTGGCSGSGCGAVYKLTPTEASWTETTLYSFTGHSDGSVPYCNLLIDSAGNLYGTTSYGAPYQDYGTVFELVRSEGGWSERTLYTFQGGSDGGNPEAGLIIDAAGNLYGGTTEANGNYLLGVAFEVSPSGSGWTYSVISSLSGPLVDNLSFDAGGTLYGTSPFGGVGGWGYVFKLSNSGGVWTQTDRHDFSNQNHGGFGPWSSVAIDSAGNLYGTTNGGGASEGGIIWKIAP